MRKILLIMTALLMVLSGVYGQKPVKINLKAEKSTFEISQKTTNGFTIKGSISELKLEPQAYRKGNYMKLEVEGLIKIFEEGIPNIPVLSKMIEVPQGASVEFIFKSYEEEIIVLSEYGIFDKIMPALRSQSKSEDEVPFVIKEEIYKTDRYVNNPIATYEESGQMRAFRLGRIELRPIQYNPVKNTLRILNNFVIEVRFNNPDISATNELKKKYGSAYFNNVLEQQAINFDTESNKELITQLPTHLVIVSDRMFETQLVPFIAWKVKKGFKVTVGYTDVIGSSTTAIKTWLQNIYQGSDPMTFVLLVGDVAQIPAWAGGSGSHVTDLRYCEYTGDNLPEVYYGRFSAQNPGQLQPQIDKTLEYEQFLMPDPSYLEEVVMVAGDDASYEMIYGNGQINYGTSYYFNSSNNIYSNTYLQPLDNSAASVQIIQNISDGVSYGNYTAHCSSSGWATPSFVTSHIPGLQNAHKYGLLVGNCCLSSKFDDNECFGEALLRAENKGAIGYIGGSNSTYWDEDYWWGCGLGTAVQFPVYENFGTGAYDGVFHNLSNEVNNLSKWFITQDQMVKCGQLAVESSSSSRKQYYWEIYHLMGDPTVINYIGIPQSMTVTPNPSALMIGMTSLTVSSAPYSYVALSQGGVLVAVGMSDASGNASLSFESTALSVGTADLTVTSQNRIPYIGTITVSPANEPYIVLNSYTTNISPDYGQTIELNVTLENVAASGSGYDAANVIANISITDSYVTINDGTENFGTINAGSTSTVNGAFQITLANNVPDQYTFSFAMTITGDDAKYTWPGTLTLKANAPVITIGEVFVTSDDNSDGRLDPGETGDINFTITNTGHASALFGGTLSKNNDPENYLTLGNTALSGISIAAGNSEDFTYTGASADINTPLGTTVGLQLDATAGASNQYTKQSNQNFVIGLIPIYLISDQGTLTVCTGTFYDSGGPDGEYQNSEDYTMTFLPPVNQDFVVIEFTSFSTESGYDKLYIYDGPNNTYPQISGSPFQGTTSPGTIMGANGLTFYFHSDGSVTRPGWSAEVSCYTATTPPECAENPIPVNNATNVFPVNISWSPSIGATSYDLYFGTDSDPYTNTPINVESTVYNVNVDPSTTYYWAVLPVNNVGTASGCDIWNFTTGAAQYLMSNGTVTTCEGVFFDSGGADGNYQNSEDYTMTFLPSVTGNMIQMFFNEFDVELGSSGTHFDYLRIYDGPNTSAPLIGEFSSDDGAPVPSELQPVTASNESGALTFVFHSDSSIPKAGWSADISCVTMNYYTITFSVTDGTSPIEGAAVNFNSQIINTNASGIAVFEDVLQGNGMAYSVTKTGYYTVNGTVDVDDNKTVDIIMSMVPPSYTITFNVSDGTNPIINAIVNFDSRNINTDSNGDAVFENVLEGSSLPYTVTKNGFVTLTGTIDADSDKTVNLIMVPNGIEELMKEITVLPNPNNGIFTINLGSINYENAFVKIYTISGQLIYNSNILSSSFNVDISDYSKGVYFLKLSLQGYEINSKLIVK